MESPRNLFSHRPSLILLNKDQEAPISYFLVHLCGYLIIALRICLSPVLPFLSDVYRQNTSGSLTERSLLVAKACTLPKDTFLGRLNRFCISRGLRWEKLLFFITEVSLQMSTMNFCYFFKARALADACALWLVSGVGMSSSQAHCTGAA